MRNTALAEQTNLVFAHAAQEVSGGLKRPAEFHAGIRDPVCNIESAVKVNGKVRIEQRHLLNVVATHEFRKLTDYAFGRERIEPALIKHHVGAVIAGIGTPNTGRISELADSASSLICIEINQIKGWGGEGFQTLNSAFGIMLL